MMQNRIAAKLEKSFDTVSERMLHEYWLPHFRDCIVEGQGAVGDGLPHNAINGTPNNINHWLLTEILKEQWGFKGIVVSDLGAWTPWSKGHAEGADEL